MDVLKRIQQFLRKLLHLANIRNKVTMKKIILCLIRHQRKYLSVIIIYSPTPEFETRSLIRFVNINALRTVHVVLGCDAV